MMFIFQRHQRKETVCKTVQNQTLFFFSPTSSPSITTIIIVIATIVVNIFENITHWRRTAREQILKDTHSSNLKEKKASESCTTKKAVHICKRFSTRSPTSLFTIPSLSVLQVHSVFSFFKF